MKVIIIVLFFTTFIVAILVSIYGLKKVPIRVFGVPLRDWTDEEKIAKGNLTEMQFFLASCIVLLGLLVLMFPDFEESKINDPHFFSTTSAFIGFLAYLVFLILKFLNVVFKINTNYLKFKKLKLVSACFWGVSTSWLVYWNITFANWVNLWRLIKS